ncbi:DUF2271 domain-containing protein [Chiayiivirga flava]|uniref:DUF2271 domain-containing protein n=1 Tax=Chiayiivirga flava TaxID=659595 RepID=A0A7W8D742_9GAMM|nr:DUF2271 domain-containing protein [Chiayiivirga flava]MBB5209128.1 hypothetical protein [Chiayiivirga flava]
MKRSLLFAALLSVAALPAAAAGLKVDIEVPQLDVAEYHRPYVAVWIEREDSSVAANLSVWYQQERGKPRPQKDGKKPETGDGGGEAGTKWLPDLRQWWRRSGRALTLPVDGVTGATRPVGTHTLTFDSTSPQLADLAPGSYRLVVEAAREVGGRELLKLPFAWPPTDAAQSDVQGKTEFGRVALALTP